MIWEYFKPGEEPTVITANLCAVFGCGACPGLAKARDRGLDDLDPDEFVACNHKCHELTQ